MRTLAYVVALLAASIATAQAEPLPPIADKTKGLVERLGLLSTYVDEQNGAVYIKLPPPAQGGLVGEYLYAETLASGLGSNDLGLDKNSFGPAYILDVKVVGKKALFEAQNYSFRAHTPDGQSTTTLPSQFGTSVVWAGDVIGRDPDGSCLVDATSFAVRDAHNVTSALKGYQLDSKRSILDAPTTKDFPDNLEFGAMLTFSTSSPSPVVGEHAPDSQSVTLFERQSLVKLPPEGFHPRKFDPRTGNFATEYMDFDAPLGQPLLKQLINRFRLEKTDPTAKRSTVKKPIVFYVDRSAPEPIRSALIAGGNFWARAFDAAGFIDAYRVEEMPADMDPLDVRNNVVLWLDRSTRGWAYGQELVDPRTGEVIRGAVNLDAQRVRQDIQIYEALLGTSKTGTGSADDPVQIALTRVRQLGAHEIGHSLGFQHNFAASTYGRASVMDYPAPKIRITADGKLDLSDAYAPSIGAWDVQAIRYAYTQFAPTDDEPAELDKIIHDGLAKGLLFLSDDDADEPTGADARATRWDNGNDPVANLQLSLKIRRIAIRNFGEQNIKFGQPIALLEEVFGPLYFFHRYDIDGVAKLVGGQTFVHAVRGDGQTPQTPVPAQVQLNALSALLHCLDPEVLNVPDRVAKLMGPRPNGYGPNKEEFPKSATYLFDTLAAATAGADMVVSRLTNPSRCARIVELSTRASSLPDLQSVFGKLVAYVTSRPSSPLRMSREIAQSVDQVVATRLMDLATDETASPRVAAEATQAVRTLRHRLQDPATAWMNSGVRADLEAQILRFLNRPLNGSPRESHPLPALPGAPIGAWGEF